MDLDAPLGMTPPPKPSRLGLVLAVTGAVAVLALVVGVGIFFMTADPHGGEPYAVAQIQPQLPKPPPAATPGSAALDPTATGSVPSVAPVDRASALVAAGPKPAPAASPAPGAPLIIDVARALADRQQLASVPPTAPIAATADPSDAAADPRVAIFVSGMGLSEAATRTATELMPPAVTFAFVPTGAGVAAAVAAAKAKGHEILLQIPMQTASGAALGPHALRAGETPDDVSSDAAWLMTRFGDYDGVTNLLGAPVTSDRIAMGALLKAIAGRGLFYLDDGTSQRSLARGIALEQGVPAARADIVLDATADPVAVRANLETLLVIARRNGSAIGMASGLPDHLAEIAAFASALGQRKVRLVPVGDLVGRRGASVAVAR